MPTDATSPEISTFAKRRWRLFFEPNGLRVIWGLLGFVVSFAILGYLWHLARISLGLPVEPPGDDLPQFIPYDGIHLLWAVGATAIMAWVEGRRIWAYGLADSRPVRRFLWGAACGLGLISLLVGGLALTGALVFDERLLHGADILGLGAAWAIQALFVGLFEETLFRGYLQTTLARLVGFWPAAIILSALFGLAHLGNDDELAFGILTAATGGLLFTLCLRLTGSLWWGIGFHTAWNWGQAFLYGAPGSGIVHQGRLFLTHAAGDPRWSGGTAGPEGSWGVMPVLCLALVIVLVTLKPAARAGRLGIGPQ